VTQPHDDPLGEARNQILQGLAVVATVGEAAARWAAVGIQNRAAAEERQDLADQAARRIQRAATDAADKKDQALIDKGLTDWLSRATMDETVRLWRTATVHAATGNHRAAQAAGLAAERLRQMNEPLMHAYDRRRASGMSQAEAMRAAAYDVARTYPEPPSGARPHGTREPQQLGQHGPAALTGGPGLLDEMDAAVRAEAGRLAAHISPEALDRLQREWREAGLVPAADAAELLAQTAREAARTGVMPDAAADSLTAALYARAATERRAADQDKAQPDNPATTRVDEHHQGHARGETQADLADGDLAAAGSQQRRLMSQTFPPLTQVATVPGHVAGKAPANAVPANRRGRTR